jgi:ribosomal protein S18 acetylase RimI-like enzyme
VSESGAPDQGAAPVGALPEGWQLATDLGDHLPAFLRLAASASAAHDAFAFRDVQAALDFYDELFRRGGADFAPPVGRLLLVNGRPAGMFAVVPPAALKRSRLIGGLMFARSEKLRGDPALGERLRLAAGTFVRPGAADGYLSRLAVDPAMAGRGIGRRLLDEALAATRALGLTRCVLEVADTNDRAADLYRRAGFERVGQLSTADPETGATLGYLHMARAV